MTERLELLQKLYEGISGMADEGKFGETSLPDDCEWLADVLADIEQTATEPGQPTPTPTPTLWRLVSGHLWRDDTPIASMDTEREADAAFIVLACNAHAELVAACKNAEYQLRREAVPLQNNKSSSRRYLKTLDGLQTAIAKAIATC